MTGVDFGLFVVFAQHVACTPEVEADFRLRLASLDAYLKSGDEVAQRYWRLISDQMQHGLSVSRRDTEACLDRIVAVAAILFHWTERHGAPRHAN
jgi:hypothetical protein